MLTKSELEIMELMWKAEEPLTSSQIIDLSNNRSWKKSYVHLLLNSLVEKGMIEIVGFVKTTKNYARTFKAKVAKEEYTVGRFTSMQSYEQEDIPAIVSALVQRTEDTSLIDRLDEMIEKRKAELSK